MEQDFQTIIALAGSNTFGSPVTFEGQTDTYQETFEKRIEDYADAHAEAVAHLQELSAG